jgi:hypothetical protein
MKNLIGAILLFSVVVWGCQKGDQTLGVNLLPGVKIFDTRHHQDKSSITTSIFTDTKIRVDRPQYNLLGSFNDPIFGRTDASFAAQFRLPYHPDYKASAQIDSIVLRMYYKKIYGDTISTQTLNVYELTSGLNYNAKYLSSFNIKSFASADPIGTTSFIPKFRTDSLKTDTTQQLISLRLKNSFGNYLLGIDSLKMTDNDVFLNVFKGLYIGASPVNRRGTLVSINSSSSMIVLYYHDSQKDTLGFAYRVTGNSANVSGYVHDYTRAAFYPNLDKENNSDSLIYIQPTGGIKSKILVPSLSLWKDSVKYAINKATLTFHVDTILSDYRRYPMPSRIYLKVITDTGEEEFPSDSQLSSNYYGGFYDHTTATYSFNVTQHLQQLIDGTIKNNGFYLVQSERNTSAQRVVLKGQGSFKPVELNIAYTRYKE